MPKSTNDLQNLQLNMKLIIEHEEGIPMQKRKSGSLYDQLTSELITKTDKQGLFIVTQQAKKEITPFRHWLRTFEKAQETYNYYAQVGYNKEMKLGIRVWCYIDSKKTTNNKKLEHLGGAGKRGRPRRSPTKK